MAIGDGALDMPFEESQGPEVVGRMRNALLSSGVVITGGTIENPDNGETLCVIMFKFADGVGGYYREIALIQDTNEMKKLKELVFTAVNASVRMAEAANAGKQGS